MVTKNFVIAMIVFLATIGVIFSVIANTIMGVEDVQRDVIEDPINNTLTEIVVTTYKNDNAFEYMIFRIGGMLFIVLALAAAYIYITRFM